MSELTQTARDNFLIGIAVMCFFALLVSCLSAWRLKHIQPDVERLVEIHRADTLVQKADWQLQGVKLSEMEGN